LRSVALLAFTLALGCSGSDDSDDPGGPGSGGSGGGSSNGDFLGSCDTRTVAGPFEGQCRDWVGDGNADLSVSCGALDGEFSVTTRCPEASRIGSCTLEPVLGISAIYGYYAPDYALADAEDHCAALEGTFDGSDDGSGGECLPECFAPYECVQACGDEPMNNGCCPCPADMIDVNSCG
jgi:hypothetical protein